MAYGITSSGWVAKSFEQIKADLESALRTLFGATIDLTADSALGQLNALYAERLASLWQLGQQVYTSAFPDGATQNQLDDLAALTGIARLPATSTKVMVTCSGTNGTVIPAGRVLSIAGLSPAVKFTNVVGGTISGGSVSLEFVCTETGPQPVYAGTLTVIETPVAGWVSASNPLDHSVLGTNIETDSAFRLRRELSLRTLGGASVDAIRAKVSAVSGVTECFVFENPTSGVVNGLPSYTFEVVVIGGDPQAIVDAIFSAKPAGIASYGTSSGTAIDSGSFSHTVKYSRPVDLNVWVTIDVTVSAKLAPANIDTLIKNALLSYAAAHYHTGSSVIAQALVPSIFEASAGVLDLAHTPYIGTAASPVTSATIQPTNHQIARLDSSRIVVNVTRV